MTDEGLASGGQNSNFKDANGSEKRYLPRWTVNHRVIYQKENDSVSRECRSKNIHCEGACIDALEMLTSNQNLTLTFFLFDDVAVEVQGKVQWILNNAQQNLIGLQFYNVSQKVQDLILQYAFRVNKEGLIKHWFEGW